jgi:hypothetical protein
MFWIRVPVPIKRGGRRARAAAPGRARTTQIRYDPHARRAPDDGDGRTGGDRRGVADPWCDDPDGCRRWTLIAPAEEAAPLDELRVVLGNPTAVRAVERATAPFPDGTVPVKRAWKGAPPKGAPSATVPGAATTVQVRVKDAQRCAATGGWCVDDPLDGPMMKACRTEQGADVAFSTFRVRIGGIFDPAGVRRGRSPPGGPEDAGRSGARRSVDAAAYQRERSAKNPGMSTTRPARRAAACTCWPTARSRMPMPNGE